MIQKEIKYIGFYQNPLGISKRNQALSAVNKMDYIASAINEAGFKVHMITPSWMLPTKDQPFFEKTKTVRILPWKKITAVSSWRTSTKVGGYFKIIWSLLWLFSYLVLNTKRNEKILVYHSPWLSLPIILAQSIRKFNLILEVEEIYSKVWTVKSLLSKWENSLIKSASSYLVVSNLLGDLLPNKPKIIVYGSYIIEETLELGRVDNEVRIVYAGSIDNTKGGANIIVDCAEFLPDNYKILIIGYGNEKDTQSLIEKIYIKNNLKKIAKCSFHGVKRDREYANFLLSCDIGVNSQINGDYMQTAFPSKILSYLAHNLKVISTPIESVKTSILAPYIYFSDEDKPKSIADRIKKISLDDGVDSRNKIKELHLKFVNDLKNLISN